VKKIQIKKIREKELTVDSFFKSPKIIVQNDSIKKAALKAKPFAHPQSSLFYLFV